MLQTVFAVTMRAHTHEIVNNARMINLSFSRHTRIHTHTRIALCSFIAVYV